VTLPQAGGQLVVSHCSMCLTGSFISAKPTGCKWRVSCYHSWLVTTTVYSV